jgi:hypothetical protein
VISGLDLKDPNLDVACQRHKLGKVTFSFPNQLISMLKLSNVLIDIICEVNVSD